MWKKGRTIAVCMFAAAWWGVFYPELCFTEETCEAVRTEESGAGDGQIDVGEIWRADSGEIVISSKFLEWCEKHLSAQTE